MDLSVEDRIFIEKLIDTVKEKLSRKEMKILKLRLNGVSKAVAAKLMKTSNVSIDIGDSTDTGGAGDFYSEFPESQSRTDQEANE